MPLGPLPSPAQPRGPDFLLRASGELGTRGAEPAYAARALVETARRTGDAALARRAVDLAPDTPVVALEALRAWLRPEFAASAARALTRSFPALLWAAVAGGAVLGGALLFWTLGLQIFGALRGLPLLGHAFAHSIRLPDLVAWAGALLFLALLALLAGVGLGPASLIALVGCVSAMRLRAAESVAVALSLVISGLVLGPGLDLWARAAAHLEPGSALASAWRVERGYPLPGDALTLDRALEKRPGDALVRLALAKARLRVGDSARARVLLASEPAEWPEVRAAERSLRGALELGDGNVGKAVEEYERAREQHESAAVLFNLSQAYGRALRLDEQAPTYRAARLLDPHAVERYASAAVDAKHLIVPVNVPARVYLARATSASPAATRLARELRSRLLGRGLPDATWMALPLLGLVGVGLRRGTITRCKRCERTLCSACSPENRDTSVCVRCVRLFEDRQNIDARVRKEQLEIDRRRQRRLDLRTGGLALLLPGFEPLLRGRCSAGALQLGCAAFGAVLLLSSRWTAAPWEVGPLGIWIGWIGGIGLLAPACLFAAAQALRSARAKGRRR
jgi:tetratricopeptide (TPR) repeat protein